MREKGCTPVLIDSHCHLYMPEFRCRPRRSPRARPDGGPDGLRRHRIRPGLQPASRCLGGPGAGRVRLRRHPSPPCRGRHRPTPSHNWQTLAAHPRVVGIGEIGLDFYRNRAPREMQEAAFRAQLGLARSLRLPVSIHDRDAHADTMRILSDEADGLPAVILHCFSGDRAMAAEAWNRGYYTAVAGPVTYPNARGLRDLLHGRPARSDPAGDRRPLPSAHPASREAERAGLSPPGCLAVGRRSGAPRPRRSPSSPPATPAVRSALPLAGVEV